MKRICNIWAVLVAVAILCVGGQSIRAIGPTPRDDNSQIAAASEDVGPSDADWPMWRYDAGRSGASPEGLPQQLHLQWSRDLPTPRPAFPPLVRPRLCFDKTYRPVAADGLLFVPSMVTDTVTAYDLDTGVERWRFFADAPVRLAPAVYQDRVYFVSDDGYLYCLEAATGDMIWRFTPLEASRRAQRLLGDGRMISRWPARGGPVVHEGTIYFTFGFLPYEGVYVCAVDAGSGQLRWVNEKASFIRDGLVDHGARRVGGLSPQGYLAVVDDRLIVPGGRSIPGYFDLQTGQMEPHTTGWGGRDALAKGVWYSAGAGDYFFQGGDMFAISPELGPPPPEQRDKALKPEEFADLAQVPVEQVQKWIEGDVPRRAGELVTTERDGQVLINPLDQYESNYVAWGGHDRLKTEGERHILRAHPRVQVDPANYRELGVFREPVMTEDAMFYSSPADHRLVGEPRGGHRPKAPEYAQVIAYDTTEPNWGYTCTTYVRFIAWPTARFHELWRLESNLKVQMKAGNRLYGGAPGVIGAIDIPEAGAEPKESWRAEIEGNPGAMLACDDRLVTVTEQGRIYCFGPDATDPQHYQARDAGLPTAQPSREDDVERMLRRTVPEGGYCLALGVGNGEFIDELVRQSDMDIVVLEPDAEAVADARRRYDRQGLYGSRVHIIPANPASAALARYFASLVVAEDQADAELLMNAEGVESLCKWLRPYGGWAWLPSSVQRHESWEGLVEQTDTSGVDVLRRGEFTVVRRPGELPGSDDWTHESGSQANTFASGDDHVRTPLGVLWFGGSVDKIFPPWDYTHKRGPFPVISGGRMFILVANEVHAADVYTGRLLWSVSLEETEKTRQRTWHHMHYTRPWAENFVATPDMLYVVGNGTCLQISPVSGKRLGELPVAEELGDDAEWDEMRVSGDYLVGTAGDHLLCLNRKTGQELWRFASPKDTFNFCIGEKTTFCVDYWLPEHLRRGEVKTELSEVSAFDLQTGQVQWRQELTQPVNPVEDGEPTGSPLEPCLQYSPELDVVLLTLNRSKAVRYGSTWKDEPGTIAGYRGADGEVLWTGHVPCRDIYSKYSGPELPIVLSDRFITHAGQVFDPMTGEEKGERLWVGMNCNNDGGGLRGCNRAVANSHLATARDSIASYFRIDTGQQGFFAGIRSGCTNSLIPAEGILNAPNLSHGCACNTPVFVSSGFVQMPEAAEWLATTGSGDVQPTRAAQTP